MVKHAAKRSDGFRDWLRGQIADRFLTQGDFAVSAGISRAQLQKFLIRKHTPTPLTLTKIANGLGIAREELQRHWDRD